MASATRPRLVTEEDKEAWIGGGHGGHRRWYSGKRVAWTTQGGRASPLPDLATCLPRALVSSLANG